MPDTFTAHYNFTQPEVNASRDTWGGKHNANWASLDNILKSITDRITATTVKKPASGEGSNPLEIRWDGTRSQIVMKVDNTDMPLARKSDVDAAIMAWVPRGVILAWSGSIANIPAGWALCNGQNGTPNLNRRFIWGAGSSLAVGNAGGAEAHAHGGGTAGHVLTWGQMPSHAHGVADPGHTHGYTDPGHQHNFAVPQIAQGGSTIQGGRGIFTYEETRTTDLRATGIQIHGAGTGIAIHNAGGNEGHLHGIASDGHVPPYFVLAYIMKL